MAERVHHPGSFGFFLGVGVVFFMICFYATKKNEYGTPKMETWKINLVFKGMIFRFYVNFQDCTAHKFQVFESSSVSRCVTTGLTLCRNT